MSGSLMAPGPAARTLPGAAEGARRSFDVVAYLTVWLVFLYGISARQVVPGFGAIGSPAMLIAMPTFLIWCAGWVLPQAGLNRGPNPMRAGLILYLAYQILSFAVAQSRTLTPLETTGAMRALLTAFAMAGIGLLASDGIKTVERLTTLLRRVMYGVTFVSIFGLVQFFTRQPLQILLPGLQWNRGAVGLSERGPFVRPAGTTLNSLEFSVVTASLLPLAIHFALYGVTLRQRRHAAVGTLLIALAVPLSVSRSGVISLVVGLGILFAGWRGRRLLNGLLTVIIAIPVLWATIPGIVGTFIGLFTGTDDDISIQARLRRIPRIMALIRERPWLGLGNGTWSREEYFLVDNELYVTTLEMGIVGMGLTILLLGGAVILGLCARALPGITEDTKHLALAITAAIAAFTVSLATFDVFHYRILTGTLFLLIGSAGALWQMHHGSDLFARLIRTGSNHKVDLQSGWGRWGAGREL